MENEKSIEQIALENYAKEYLDERYEKLGIIIGFVAGVLSTISFVLTVINCDTCLHDYAIIVFFAIIVFVITCMVAMACVIIFSLAFGKNEKKIVKIISLLSKEQSKKIISDAIEKKIEKCEDNIPYCEQEITELQKEIGKYQDSIEKSKQEIPNLQKKLSILKGFDSLPEVILPVFLC